MTFYVLGITVTSPCGQTWRVAPNLSGLPAAEGGFTTCLGWFGVKWSVQGAKFVLELDVPEGTRGTVVLPVDGNITVGGREVVVRDAEFEVEGGQHIVQVKQS